MDSKKGLIKKLKIGLAGLGIIGLTYFNSANAQENYGHEFFYEKGNELKEQEDYNKAIENYTQSINLVKDIRKNESDHLKIDSLKELEAKYLIGRALAFRKLFDLDNVMLDLDRVKNLKESISQKNYNPKYNNYVYEAIKIRDKGKNFYPDFKTLDDLIENSKNYIAKKNNYTKKEIEKISEKIYSNILKENSKMENVTDKCYRMSMIYLAIGKENNLPLYGILVPKNSSSHMAVIWDNSKDGHDFLNSNNQINKNDLIIEATTGKIKNSSYYISPLISKKSLEKRIYLNNLNEKEFLSTAHWSIAIEKIKKENYQEALEECNKAIELNPNSLQAYSIRAGCYGYLGRFEKSIEDLNKAIELNPEPKLFFEKASVLSELGKYNLALENYNKAINISRKFRKNEKDTLEIVSLKESEIFYLFRRSIVFNDLGNLDNSFKDIKKAKSLANSIENDQNQYNYHLILEKKKKEEEEYINSSIME